MALSITYNYFFIPKCSDTSIKTQRNSTSDASVVAHDVASGGLDQITNHRDTDVKENDYSQSFETPRKNNCSSSSFGDTLAITTKSRLSTLYPPGK